MKLIINADDFGMSRAINAAILDLAVKRKLSATTVMVNMPYWDEVINFFPLKNFGTGLHFNIVQGKPIAAQELVTSLVDNRGQFYSRKGLIDRFRKGLVNTKHITIEFEAQFNLLKKTVNEKLTHIDSHQGMHNIIWVCSAILKARIDFTDLIIRSDLSRYITKELDQLKLARPTLKNLSACGFMNVLREPYYEWIASKYQKVALRLDGNIKVYNGVTLDILGYFKRFGIPVHLTGNYEIACHPATSIDGLEGDKMLQSRISEYHMLNHHAHLNERTLGFFSGQID